MPAYKFCPDWVEEACAAAAKDGKGAIVLVIPVDTQSIHHGSGVQLIDFLTESVRDQIAQQVKMVRGGVPAEMREPPRGQ